MIVGLSSLASVRMKIGRDEYEMKFIVITFAGDLSLVKVLLRYLTKQFISVTFSPITTDGLNNAFLLTY